MKKTLKLVGIFMAVTLVTVVGGLTIYLLVINNQTYNIYDLRIIEPVAEANSYVITDSDIEYTTMKTKKVYMTSNSDNRFEIAIYAYTSNNTTDVEITSSDPDVAHIVYEGSKCYVEYLTAGYTIITVSMATVSDSFELYVYNNVADGLWVYDETYYGEYCTLFENKVIVYSDMNEYRYSYVATSSADTSEDAEINNSLLRIDTSKLDDEIFENAYIDSATKELVLTCKDGLDSNVDTIVVIQSYYIANDGSIKVCKNYLVEVHVVAYTPAYLQLVISTTPDFEEGSVFVDTTKIYEDDLTADLITSDPTVLESYLSYLKAETFLANNGESAVYEGFITQKTTKLYIKFRKVYTNGDIVYLTPTLESEVTNEEKPDTYTFLASDENSVSTFALSANKNYYILDLTNETFSTSNTYSFTLPLGEYQLSYTFVFEYKRLSEKNILDFYSLDDETGFFTYTYWDARTRYDNEIYDTNGNIIGFYFERTGNFVNSENVQDFVNASDEVDDEGNNQETGGETGGEGGETNSEDGETGSEGGETGSEGETNSEAETGSEGETNSEGETGSEGGETNSEVNGEEQE